MRALALEHLRSNQLGLYGEVLGEHGVEVDVVRLDAGERLPDWRGYDLLVVMGGGMSAYDEDEFAWLIEEKQAIRDAVDAGMPYFGVCLGSQLLASALGARVYKGPAPELGVNPVFLTEAARRDPVFRGFPRDLEAFEWHSDTFELPEGAVRLARSPRYENQAFRVGRVAYAIQCHLEPSLDDVRDWLEAWPALAVTFEERFGAGAIDAFLEDYAASVPFLQLSARQLFRCWLVNAVVLRDVAEAVQARPLTAVAGDLLGREAERARMTALLEEAREGRSGALLLRGEAGIGKSTLLDDAVARAGSMRVLRLDGAESGAELPFAGLRQLCVPLLALLDGLPDSQRAALGGALGVEAQGGGDRFAVGAALLTLLTDAAAEKPLLLVVDDAHWLDEETLTAIALVAARLEADPVAVLIGARDEETFSGSGIEELRLVGLDRPAARALATLSAGGSMAPAVVERVIDAARGNPLGLLEIPASLAPEQREGRAPLGDALADRASAEQSFLHRILALAAAARRALLVAALGDPGDVETLARAMRRLGIEPAELDAAAAAGLARLDGGQVVFRHPLVRSTVVYNTLPSERRAVHAALAQSLAPDDGDRRAWHLALAAARPDEAAAEALADVGAAAVKRRGYAGAARALELAARLTPESRVRARRLRDAALAANLAGHALAALDLVATALPIAGDDALRDGLLHLRGRIEARSGSAPAARDTLLQAAAGREADDPAGAARMLADAVLPTLRAGSPAEACAVAERAAGLACGRGGSVELAAGVMYGLALLFVGEYSRGADRVRQAADTAAVTDLVGEEQLRASLGVALHLAGERGRAKGVLEGLVAEARGSGALGVLPYALVRLADVELEAGRWTVAGAHLHEAARLARETGQAADYGLALGGLAWLHAVQGREDDCRACVSEALRLAERLGGGSALDRAGSARGLLELGQGRADEAIPPLAAVLQARREAGWSDAAITPHRTLDLLEALVAAKRLEEARDAVTDFQREAVRSARPSARAAAGAWCGVLASEPTFAHSAALAPFERARLELTYGLRLLEQDRARDAEPRLRAALDTFERLNAEPWCRRTWEALARTGTKTVRPEAGLLERLHPDELGVVLALAGGATTGEAAASLLLSRRTVEHHLANACAKLGVESRNELATLIPPSLTTA